MKINAGNIETEAGRDNCPHPLGNKRQAPDKAVLAELALEFESQFAVEAKSNQRLSAGRGEKGCLNSDNLFGTIDTKAVAQVAVAQSDDGWTDSELERQKLVLNGISVVANKRLDGRLIRWASENRCFMPIDRGTQWGNPFIMNEDGDRDRVCESFDVFFDLKPSLQNKIHSLKGKVLGCWCHPCRCHGDRLCTEANK